MKAKPRTTAKRQNSRGDVTRDRILDGAEKLFALKSYEGVSMRDIAAEAETELGTLVHHFRTKDNVFTSVLERRAAASAAMLKERLKTQIQSKGALLTADDILSAYASRIFEVARGKSPGERHFLQIITQRVPLESGHLHPSLASTYMPVRKFYLKTLRKLYPDMPPMALDSFFSLFELSFGSALFSPMQPRFAAEQRNAAKARMLERNHVRIFVSGLAAIAQPE